MVLTSDNLTSASTAVVVWGVTLLAARWLSKSSAGVVPEVDLREHELSLPKQCE